MGVSIWLLNSCGVIMPQYLSMEAEGLYLS